MLTDSGSCYLFTDRYAGTYSGETFTASGFFFCGMPWACSVTLAVWGFNGWGATNELAYNLTVPAFSWVYQARTFMLDGLNQYGALRFEVYDKQLDRQRCGVSPEPDNRSRVSV